MECRKIANKRTHFYISFFFIYIKGNDSIEKNKAEVQYTASHRIAAKDNVIMQLSHELLLHNIKVIVYKHKHSQYTYNVHLIKSVAS